MSEQVEQKDKGVSREVYGVSFWSWPIGVLLGVLCLDEFTKWLVMSRFRLGESISVLPGLLSFTYIQNTGASWGLLNRHTWALALISVIAFVAFAVLFRRLSQAGFWTAFCLALLEGGIAGNMLDRIFRGYVVDFLDLHWWPIFNVADSAICISVAGLVLLSLYQDFQERKRRK